MSIDLLIKIATGKTITDVDLEEELYDVCERVHAACDDGCPVYRLNNHSILCITTEHDCDCFKSGGRMLKFIRAKEVKP